MKPPSSLCSLPQGLEKGLFETLGAQAAKDKQSAVFVCVLAARQES